MATTYPGTIDSFTNPSGTSTLDDPDHAGQHSSANDAIEAIEAVVGTTAGTSVLKDFSAGEFPVRQEGGTLTQTLTGGTINATTLGTPTVTGGSFASPTTTGTDSGTATLTNKTLTSPKLNEDVALTATATQLNAQVLASNDGWISADEAWVYASASTITVPSGAVSKYRVGDKIKLTQITVKYFYIVGVADTLLTITGGTSYTLTAEVISSNYYSHSNPVGFPDWFSYTPTWTAETTSPTLGSSILTGRFSLNGRLCTAKFAVIVNTGGGFNAGSGLYRWAVPIASAPGISQYGIGKVFDSGTEDFAGRAELSASGTFVGLSIPKTSLNVHPSLPMTPATGDSYSASITYEI